MFLLLSVSLTSTAQSKKKKITDSTLLQPVELIALRAADNAPFAKTNIGQQALQQANTGRDLPFIIQQTPSIQVTSDAGNGIGYTGFRIRGTDATRINVTINGIPYNDAESQGTFFVNLPDFISSAQSIQIQRGVGTSTNGPGAFGGSIHINTNQQDSIRKISFNQTAGSFGSYRSNLLFNTGLLGNHWTIQGRGSLIGSDGYVDRARTRMSAAFGSIAYLDSRKSFRLNVFTGNEKTYAAWFGINQATLDTNRRFNPAGTEKPGTPYDNETDNYRQTHVQLFYNQKWNARWTMQAALYFTDGRGYFEQYKAGQSLTRYGLSPVVQGTDTIRDADLIRQLWLDNQFYGGMYSFHYQKKRTGLIIGGNMSAYRGSHFGTLVGSSLAGIVPDGHRWYDLPARKDEASAYVKWTQNIDARWQLYADVQGRYVRYRIDGFRNNPDIAIREHYFFLNPKAGINFLNGKNRLYFSVAKASKEPNRDDFEAGANDRPNSETLYDVECGLTRQTPQAGWTINLFYMRYKNQLILTGKVNDVFAYTRSNIPNSFRAGIEMEGFRRWENGMLLSGHLTLSENKLLRYTDYIDNYDNGLQESSFFETSTISFSPRVTSGWSLAYPIRKKWTITTQGRYVSKQFLDNTSNNNRKLPAYYVQDLQIDFQGTFGKQKSGFRYFLQLNNLFSHDYVSNGYSFSYRFNGTVNTENYFFPMARFNFLTGIGIDL
jgi:iron complex outermembrane receptor protein